MLGCFSLIARHTPKVINIAQHSQPLSVQISDNQTGHVYAACCCPPRTELEAYIHVIVALHLETNQWLICMVKWELSVCMQYIAAVEEAILTHLLDEGRQVLGGRQVHFLWDTRIGILWCIAVDADAR